MAALSPKAYLDLSNWTYFSGMPTSGSLGDGLTAFPVAANHYDSRNDYDAFRKASGFYGAAYASGTGTDRTILIGFEGTNLGILPQQPEFAVAQIFADLALYKGELPQALSDALAFTRSVIATAESQGIPRANIVITGHSLGAAEAEYVAAQTGLTGITYGTPGLSTDFVPPGASGLLTNYVERGDPVGNYANGFPLPVETFFLYSDRIAHYGSVRYLGDIAEAAPLVAAGLAYADPDLRPEALATFAVQAALFHRLSAYREDLFPNQPGVAGPAWMDSYTGADYLRIVSGVLGDGKPLVDDVFYYVANPDVFEARVEPEAHYAASGWREGRDPNAYFSTVGYLAAQGDVRAAGLDPLAHYDANGWREGRDPGANFDNELYLRANPDVRAAGLDPLAHFLQSGQAEGRQAYAAIGRAADIGGAFDPEFYLLANPDVARAAIAAGGDAEAFALRHFADHGWREGRDPNALFDTSAYLAENPDVARAGINPLTHYDTIGFREGRDPSAAFDTSAYLAAYADVARAGLDPLQHYLQFGALEGRSTFAGA
ncbi:alpha/beta hydrolase family protein [Methylobacterium planeticum]|uniref:Fungal lipase-like domain-containing protein n=1 Tax=Methylobacterium planeticum TaxID=2615211 RepID=A0A6N6MVX4_9HYPH|nr:hypothetical protein [Methylobacterium planeticum]KAB1075684.1 hypothetical protein F6X51_03150 [Methylobacterium planeticum]